MEAVKVKARIDEQRQIVWLESTPLPPGEVEVLVLYTESAREPSSPNQWPVLEGGRYSGGTLCREEIYDDAR
jgi:hypothetical protein